MAKEISWEIREQAEELYIIDGKTFDEVAEITGVSVAQLKRWGAGRDGSRKSEVGGQEGIETGDQRSEVGDQEGIETGDQRSEVGDQEEQEAGIPSWSDRKKEYRTAFANIKRDTVLLRKRLISKALKSLDPQDVYAISSLESTVVKVQQASGSDISTAGAIEKRIIKTPQDAVDALGDVVENKINGMLTKPGAISLAGIKEMKQALELIEKMKTKYKPEAEGAEKSEGLSDAAADKIRKQILGIK